MTLEEQSRLSYYQKIAEISTHKNVYLVQHVESRRIFVRKEQKIYNKDIYDYLKQCDNPHIPKIYECIEDEDRLILIEEYVQGESLALHLEQAGTYSEEEVCYFMITICDVLEQLHQLPQPVIHRDLKPDNIIIQDNGYLKIIDFNTAKQFEKGRDSDTVIIGTREFAAPEQYGFQQSDARTDIYAMGVMMNYLLTKDYPRNRIYFSTNMQGSLIPQIIQKCTQFAPDKRYQSVMELRQDLQKCVWGIDKAQERQQSYIYETPPQKDFGRKKGWWNLRFLPPGFRTGTVWKMLVAVFGYYLIFWVGFTMEVTNSDGSKATGAELWANRFTALLWMLFTVFFCADYLGIQKKFPGMQKPRFKYVGCILYSIAILFILVTILVIITG